MNWLDIIVLVVAVYSIFKGYSSGLVKQLASLAGIVACILLSNKVSFIILPYLRDWGIFPESLIEPAAFIISFLSIYAVVSLLGYMLHTILESVKLGLLNRIGGIVLCLAKWLIILSLVLNLIEKMDKNHSLISEDIAEKSKTYPYISPIAPAITPYLKFDFGKDEEVTEPTVVQNKVLTFI